MTEKIYAKAYEILSTWDKDTLIKDILGGMNMHDMEEFVIDNLCCNCHHYKDSCKERRCWE